MLDSEWYNSNLTYSNLFNYNSNNLDLEHLTIIKINFYDSYLNFLNITKCDIIDVNFDKLANLRNSTISTSRICRSNNICVEILGKENFSTAYKKLLLLCKLIFR